MGMLLRARRFVWTAHRPLWLVLAAKGFAVRSYEKQQRLSRHYFVLFVSASRLHNALLGHIRASLFVSVAPRPLCTQSTYIDAVLQGSSEKG